MCEQSGVEIREFRNGDLVNVKDLVYQTIDCCYPDFYCQEAVKFFKQWHHDGKILKDATEGYTIILEQGGRIIGTGTIVGNEIVRVFVESAFQKRGFGKLIMHKLEEKALSSKKFYDLLGYVTLEETFLDLENNKRLDYYKMQKSLI